MPYSLNRYNHISRASGVSHQMNNTINPARFSSTANLNTTNVQSNQFVKRDDILQNELRSALRNH